MSRICDFLRDYNIDFKPHGKNVSKRDVNIKCLFCDDPSYHLGVNKKKGFWHCWICGRSGNFIELIRELLNVSWQKAKQIADNYTIDNDSFFSNKSTQNLNKISLPFNIFSLAKKPEDILLQKLWKKALNYCKRRHVPLEVVVSWYFDTKGFLIIPIETNHVLTAYIKRSFLNSEYRYLASDNKSSSLFNYDNLKHKVAVLVEGVFDAIACGLDVSCAMLGKQPTDTQIKLLKKKVTDIVYCPDSGVKSYDILRVADKLSMFGLKCKVLKCNKGDPATNEQFTKTLRRFLQKTYGIS